MLRVHDRGGWPGAGPIERAEHELSWWDKQTNAILMLLSLVTRDSMIGVAQALTPQTR